MTVCAEACRPKNRHAASTDFFIKKTIDVPVKNG
jgi:hypothetical protein